MIRPFATRNSARLIGAWLVCTTALEIIASLRGYQASMSLEAGLSLVALLISLPIIQPQAGDSMSMIGPFAASVMIRSVVLIGGSLASVVWLHLSAAPTLLLMCGYYLMILTVESWVLVAATQD